MTSRRIASAQRMARAGPSKVARNPSPIVLTSRPCPVPQRVAHHLVVAVEQLAPTPVTQSARLRSVESTMSVYSTVASTRSAGAGRPDAGHELLDVAHQRVGVAREQQVGGAGELDEAGVREVLGQIAALTGPDP